MVGIPPIKMVIGGMVYYCYTHISIVGIQILLYDVGAIDSYHLCIYNLDIWELHNAKWSCGPNNNMTGEESQI